MKTKSILGLIMGVALLQACQSVTPEDKSKETILPLVSIENAERTSFTHTITVQGNVETDKDVLISAEMGGLITSINVKEGQKVVQGQVLAVVDASVLSSNVNELNTQLQHAEYMLEKQRQLRDKGLGTEVELEGAETQVAAIKAQIKSLNTQRGKATIKAPFSGTIDNIFAKSGQMAAPGNPVLRLVNNSTVDITADISEKHLAKIQVGTPIQVTFPNFDDKVIDLAITNVGNYIEPTNRTFRVMSTVKNNSLLLPNMLAEVHITDMNVDSALVIPSKSIMKSQDNEDFVYVAISQNDSTFSVKRVVIDLVERQAGKAYIKDNEDIKNGTQIIVEGGRGVNDKDIVRKIQ